MVWCTVWLYFISEDPREDKYISAEELKYITENQDSAERPNVRLYKKKWSSVCPALSHFCRNVQFSEAPWRQMLTSVPLWSAIMSQTVHNSTYYTMLTQLPTYLNGFLTLEHFSWPDPSRLLVRFSFDHVQMCRTWTWTAWDCCRACLT